MHLLYFQSPLHTFDSFYIIFCFMRHYPNFRRNFIHSQQIRSFGTKASAISIFYLFRDYIFFIQYSGMIQLIGKTIILAPHSYSGVQLGGTIRIFIFNFSIQRSPKSSFQPFFTSSHIIIMPKSSSRTKKIPKFIKKLNQILENSKYTHLISWQPDGESFKILDTSKFIDQVLPQNFNHKNMASFVRQLNMYGFTRPRDSDHNVYAHPRFIKGNLNSMRQIQRRAHQGLPENEVQILFENQITHDQIDNNSQLEDMCRRIIEENKKLREENEELKEKLEKMKNNKVTLQKYNENMSSFFANWNNHNNSSSPIINNNPVEPGKEIWTTPNIHSFIFNPHSSQNSLLSYQILLQGSKSHHKST